MHNIFILTFPRSGSTAYSGLLINELKLDNTHGDALMVTVEDVSSESYKQQLKNYQTVYRYFPWDDWDEHGVVDFMYSNVTDCRILLREIQDWILSRLFLEQTKQYNVHDSPKIDKNDIKIDFCDNDVIRWIDLMCDMAAKLAELGEKYPKFHTVRYEDINYQNSKLPKQWDKDFKISKCVNYDRLLEQLDKNRKTNKYFQEYLNKFYKDMLWY